MPSLSRWWDKKKEWNVWYAWRPVWLNGQWVWLERIERKLVSDEGMGSPDFAQGWKWIYRDLRYRL